MNIYYELEMLKNSISRYEYKTIVRQIKNGDYEEVEKSIERIKRGECK